MLSKLRAPFGVRLRLAFRAAVRERHGHRRSQRGDQEIRDLGGGTVRAPLAVRDERVGRVVQRSGPTLVDRAERAQELDPFAEVRAHGVEHAHDREILPERRAPLLDMIAGRDHVDQRHSRPAGPAQDFHVGFVLATVRAAAVDDIENPRALDDRREQLALVVKARIARVRLQELRDDGPACARAAVVRFEPCECFARALKAGRVDELVQNLAVESHRVRARLRGRARVRRDGDRIVLGERSDDAALALVWMADDRETRPIHAAPVSR